MCIINTWGSDIFDKEREYPESANLVNLDFSIPPQPEPTDHVSIDGVNSFDAIRHHDPNGEGHWKASELEEVLGLGGSGEFTGSKKVPMTAFMKAYTVATTKQLNVRKNFCHLGGVDFVHGEWHLTALACYLVFSQCYANGEKFLSAQKYFADLVERPWGDKTPKELIWDSLESNSTGNKIGSSSKMFKTLDDLKQTNLRGEFYWESYHLRVALERTLPEINSYGFFYYDIEAPEPTPITAAQRVSDNLGWETSYHFDEDRDSDNMTQTWDLTAAACFLLFNQCDTQDPSVLALINYFGQYLEEGELSVPNFEVFKRYLPSGIVYWRSEDFQKIFDSWGSNIFDEERKYSVSAVENAMKLSSLNLKLLNPLNIVQHEVYFHEEMDKQLKTRKWELSASACYLVFSQCYEWDDKLLAAQKYFAGLIGMPYGKNTPPSLINTQTPLYKDQLPDIVEPPLPVEQKKANPLGAICRYDKNGVQFWTARNLMHILDIDSFAFFEDRHDSLISNAIAECQDCELKAEAEFGKKHEDWDLSYMACHFIFKRFNDLTFPKVRAAQEYFGCFGEVFLNPSNHLDPVTIYFEPPEVMPKHKQPGVVFTSERPIADRVVNLKNLNPEIKPDLEKSQDPSKDWERGTKLIHKDSGTVLTLRGKGKGVWVTSIAKPRFIREDEWNQWRVLKESDLVKQAEIIPLPKPVEKNKSNPLPSQESQSPDVSPFDAIRHHDQYGEEYWTARELMKLLKIRGFGMFKDSIPNSIISRAMALCEAEGVDIKYDFRKKEKDWELTAIACYSIFIQCSRPTCPDIEKAQEYFAKKVEWQTHLALKLEQEIVHSDAPSSVIPLLPEENRESEQNNSDGVSAFDAIRRYDKDGNEYWSARELMEVLGYQRWETFGGQKKGQTSVIQKAIKSLKNSGYQSDDHVRYASKMVNLPQGGYRTKEDWELSRRACYVMAMNGDPNKEEIALAQAYFTDQARENELRKQREAEPKKKTASEAIAFATQCLIDAGIEKPVVNQYQLRQLAKLEPENAQYYETACKSLASAYTLENKPILVTKVGQIICDRLGLNRNMISFAKVVNQKLIEIGFQEKDIRYKDNKPYNKGYVLTKAGEPWGIVENPTDSEGRVRPQIKYNQ